MGYEYSKGCDLCRQRKVKCDETKPGCLRCRQYNVPCPGYSARPLRFLIAASGQQPPSVVNRRRTASVSEEQIATVQSSIAQSGSQQDAASIMRQDEEDLLRLFNEQLDSVCHGRPKLFDFLRRLAFRGPLSQQCVLLLPAAMLASFIRKAPDPALTHINRCLNSIRSRLEIRANEFDPELFISIASMAHLDNLTLLYTQGFYNPLDNVARHWQASVALIQQYDISAIQPGHMYEVILWNWTDCTMIVPQLLADYQRFDPRESPQSETRRSQSIRVWEDVSLLYCLLEPEQSIFEDNQVWASMGALQSARLRQGLRKLHDILTAQLSGRIRDLTHIMVYGSLGIIIYIHCMLLFNTTYVYHTDFWSRLMSALTDMEEHGDWYMCCLHQHIFLVTNDEDITTGSTKGKEKEESSSQHPLWDVSRAVRVAKLLSEPILRRVIDTLLSNLLRMSTTVEQERTTVLLTEDDLCQDITAKTEAITFLQSLSQEHCPFGELHPWMQAHPG